MKGGIQIFRKKSYLGDISLELLKKNSESLSWDSIFYEVFISIDQSREFSDEDVIYIRESLLFTKKGPLIEIWDTGKPSMEKIIIKNNLKLVSCIERCFEKKDKNFEVKKKVSRQKLNGYIIFLIYRIDNKKGDTHGEKNNIE